MSRLAEGEVRVRIEGRDCAFACTGCGACCRIQGEVSLAEDDIERLAGGRGLDRHAFEDRYTRLSANRRQLALTDGPEGACVFLGDDNRCQVYPHRPRQCRRFPFPWTRLEDCEGLRVLE